jgi:uncharacterized membrane protein YgcG
MTKTNYYEWATLMRVMLQARGMWHAVKEVSEDYMEDRMALEVIAKVVQLDMLGSIASKPAVKVAWDSIMMRNVGVDRVKKAKASSLKHEFDVLTFLDDESVDDFGVRIGRITNQLAVLGCEYEEEIVQQFLLVLPPKFKQIAISIEMLDLESMTVDELIGHLKPSEERMNRNNSNTVASLNLSEDELVVRLSSRLKLSGNGGGDRSKESPSSGSKRGHGRGKGRGCRGGNSGGRGGGRGGGETSDRDNAGRGAGGGNDGDVTRDECHYCGRRGHWARECKKKKCDEELHAT